MITDGDISWCCALERCELAPGDFGHREHVRAAWTVLQVHDDFAVAAARLVSALRRFAAHCGRPERYHATLTFAWLALVAERLAQAGAGALDFAGFAARFPELFDSAPGVLARYYDPAVLAGDVARRTFVLPRGLPPGSLP
jgi:hypothetical protein